MPNSKVIGGILLIVGTSIGGGMLALPVSTAAAGITNAFFFLIFCWLVMTAGALLMLEVNLRFPAGSNIISMVQATLGFPGQVIAWITYLFLLYALLAAYISGGSDVFQSLLNTIHIHWPSWFTTLLFTLIFGFVIYSGIRTVDYVNRGLMFGKLGIYLLLVFIISPYIKLPTLQGGTLSGITGSLMILITSFGFASIVPSLRAYFDDDIKALRKIILYGSLIPLFCYIIWEVVIMGVVHREGPAGLLTLVYSEHATSGLTEALSHTVHNRFITGFFGFFTSICMITAFLGVSMGLFDFIADGLKLKRGGKEGKLTFTLTFLPPLMVVLIQPGIYLRALNYAGICCVILLLLLPAVMAWRSRQQYADTPVFIPGGRISLGLLIIVASLLLIVAWYFS